MSERGDPEGGRVSGCACRALRACVPPLRCAPPTHAVARSAHDEPESLVGVALALHCLMVVESVAGTDHRS